MPSKQFKISHKMFFFLIVVVVVVAILFGVPQLTARYSPDDKPYPYPQLTFRRYQGVTLFLVLASFIIWLYSPLMMTLWIIIGLLVTLCFCSCSNTRMLSLFPIHRWAIPQLPEEVKKVEKKYII